MMFQIIKLLTLISIIVANQSFAKQASHQIDELFKTWDNKTKPGIAVGVNKDNQTVYEKYYGISNLDYSTPINAETKFLIASVSKQFTAFAIALLEHENKLSFKDEIHKHIPELPKYSHQVTVMHLLNHTSGLRDSDDLNGLVGAGLSDYVSFNDVYKLIKQQKGLNFIPGSKYDYSNSGYILLAKIVENISGKSFREFMDERVFKPLEMHDTLVFDNPFEVIGNKATAYFSNDGENFSANNLFSAVYGSTGIYTTLNDLNKWAKNYTNPKVGDKSIFTLMKIKGLLSDGSQINYGLGQEMKTHKGHNVVFHGGGQGAYRAYLLRFPESNLSVNILSNNSYSTSFIIDYAYKIAELYLEKSPNDLTNVSEIVKKIDKIEPVIVKESILKKYTGDYQIQPGLIFTLKQKKEKLELFITGNDNAIPLKAISSYEFMLIDSNNGYKIVFPNDSSDDIKSFSYYQNDFEYIGKRVQLVEFDKEKINWSELEGLYYSEELNTAYSLAYDGESLKAHHARNMPIKLTPHQPDAYNGTATFFQEIKFIRNDSGKVVEMLVSGSRSKHINFIKLIKSD